MSTPKITGFVFDDDNEEEFAVHGFSARRVLQVLDNEHVVVPNRKKRRGLYLVIGLDHGGACLTIPVEPTRDPMIWRPITAWSSKKHERARLS